MVYKKFKDYKLGIIKMLFIRREPAEVLKEIEALETSNSITPSQVQQLTDMVFNGEIYKILRPANMSQALASRLKYDQQIFVYKGSIIASYYPDTGTAVLE